MKKKKGNILIVDDDPLMINLIKYYLSSENYGVTSTKNGRKALSILQKKKFDLIIADMQMPEMDGGTLVRTIKDNYKITTPVIIMTAYTPIDNFFESISGYTHEIIRKPFSSSQLNQSVSKALNKK